MKNKVEVMLFEKGAPKPRDTGKIRSKKVKDIDLPLEPPEGTQPH